MSDCGHVWITRGIDELLRIVIDATLGADVASALLARFQSTQAAFLTSWTKEETRRAGKARAPAPEATARLSDAQLAFCAHAVAYCDIVCDIAARNVCFGQRRFSR